MHRLDVNGTVMGVAGAFAMGMARHKMRRAAYVEAVIEARDREALHRRIRALEAQVAAQSRQAVDRKVRQILTNLPG